MTVTEMQALVSAMQAVQAAKDGLRVAEDALAAVLSPQAPSVPLLAAPDAAAGAEKLVKIGTAALVLGMTDDGARKWAKRTGVEVKRGSRVYVPASALR